MNKIWISLLTLSLIGGIGCGYSSHNGMMASSAPMLTQLMPKSMAAGGNAFTLNVNGNNFANGAVVYWNGSPRSTKFVSATQLSAAISASDVAMAATVSVFVKNPGGTGMYGNQVGQPSNTMDFTVAP
jgi:hypothetical protein